MTEQHRDPRVDQFILDQIDSVTHLEALLLIWNSRPKLWSIEDMGKVLYVRNEFAGKILDSLAQRGLIAVASAGTYTAVVSDAERTRLLEAVDAAYRRELIRISSMIHSKAPAGVRDFARAFRFTRDKE